MMITKLYGHRGLRGIYPENSMYGFKQCGQYNLVGIEFDVVVNKDHQLVVSHEPWMNHLICQSTSGIDLHKSNQQSFNLYQMQQSKINQFDCGTQPHPDFPLQTAISSTKPLLQTLIDELNQLENQPLHILIEIKSYAKWYGVFQPQPAQYAALIVDFLKQHPLQHRFLIQSFDAILLNELHQLNPNLQLGLLVDNQLSINENLSQLNFKPSYLNSEHTLITAQHVNQLKQMGIDCIPWTVNTTTELKRLYKLGITACISDYPLSYFKADSSPETTAFKNTPDTIDNTTKVKKK